MHSDEMSGPATDASEAEAAAAATTTGATSPCSAQLCCTAIAKFSIRSAAKQFTDIVL